MKASYHRSFAFLPGDHLDKYWLKSMQAEEERRKWYRIQEFEEIRLQLRLFRVAHFFEGKTKNSFRFRFSNSFEARGALIWSYFRLGQGGSPGWVAQSGRVELSSGTLGTGSRMGRRVGCREGDRKLGQRVNL